MCAAAAHIARSITWIFAGSGSSRYSLPFNHPKMVSASALPQLQLTDADTLALRTLSVQLEREIVIQYEDFLFNRQRQVEKIKWKRVKSEGELDAFRERHVGELRRDTGPQSAMAARSHLPRVLITGRIQGQLGDILLGGAFQDTASLRASHAVEKDAMEDAAVLNTIETATEQDPFRFLGIVWMLRTFGLPAALMNNRDCLLLFDTHLSQLANGERVAIGIGHSIQHRDLPELQQFSTLRADSSMVQVLRQADAEHVEVFMIQYLDIKGSVPDAVHLKESIKFNLGLLQKTQNAGFNGKLRWLMLNNEKRHELTSYGSGSSSGSDERSTTASSVCELCAQPRRRGLFGRKRSRCKACYRHACHHCTSVHDIIVETPGDKPAVESVSFCIQCLLDTKNLSSFAIAKEEAMRRRATARGKERSRAMSQRVRPVNEKMGAQLYIQ